MAGFRLHPKTRPWRALLAFVAIIVTLVGIIDLAGAGSSALAGHGALGHSGRGAVLAATDLNRMPAARPELRAATQTAPPTRQKPMTGTAAPTGSAPARPAIVVATPATVMPASPAPATVLSAPVTPTQQSTTVTLQNACSVALAYLTTHAAPGFAFFCRPGTLLTAAGPSAGYTCVPGPTFPCPDGVAEIIISDPTCAVSYENEASNSYWDFTGGATIVPGAVQDGRTWDPFGACLAG